VVLREPRSVRPVAGTAVTDTGPRRGRLADSLIGWNGQLFGDTVDIEFALTNVAICWFTGMSASSARFHYENAHTDTPTASTIVPLGLASFAGDFKSIRWFVDRDHKNVVSWHEYTLGGHYAAHQAPYVLVADLRGSHRDLRADRSDT
jgi:hypothetical protein